MARAYASDVLIDAAGNAVANAAGTLWSDEAASVAVTDAYAAASGGSTTTTVTTGSDGTWQRWFTTEQTFYIKWTDNTHAAYPVGSPSTPVTFTTFVSKAKQALLPSADAAGLTAHLDDTVDAHDASAVSYVPTGTIAATDAQAAIAEVATDAAADLAAHLNDAVDAHDASAVSVLDMAGRFNSTDVEGALAELRDFVAASITERNALTGMQSGSYCWVTNIDRVYRYDGSVWNPLTDVDYINVLDYGAHYSLTDNSTAFNAAVAAAKTDYNTGGAVRLNTILVPPPPSDTAAAESGYKFTAAINLRGKAQLRFVAHAGGAAASFNAYPVVYLKNTTNTTPVLDADNQADSLTILAGNTFDGLAFYNSTATPVVTTGLVGWRFDNCAFITFADTPAITMENSFWVWFDQCAFTNANGSTNGCIKTGSRTGTTSDAENSYGIFANRCRFSGGPYVDHHYFTTTSNSSGYFAFRDCDGENQAGANGMVLRTTRDSTSTGSLSGCQFSQCVIYDPVSGSSPYTLISPCPGISISGIVIDNVETSNSATQAIKSQTTSPPVLSGVHIRGSRQWTLQKSDGTAWTSVFGFINLSGRFNTVKIGDANYPSVGTSPDMSFLNPPGAGGADFFGVMGETYARFALTYDGYQWWGPGTSATADTNLYRKAAAVLATDHSFRIAGLGQTLQVREGSNCKLGTATLVAGTVTVNTTASHSNSRIFLTNNTPGGTPGFLHVSARVESTSFTITSSSGTDTSTVAWFIVDGV